MSRSMVYKEREADRYTERDYDDQPRKSYATVKRYQVPGSSRPRSSKEDSVRDMDEYDSVDSLRDPDLMWWTDAQVTRLAGPTNALNDFDISSLPDISKSPCTNFPDTIKGVTLYTRTREPINLLNSEDSLHKRHNTYLSVYSVNATLRGATSKLIVKSFASNLPDGRSVREYAALSILGNCLHRNVIELVTAFQFQHIKRGLVYNFAFDVALCDLQQLFNDQKINAVVETNMITLWCQFEGLTSALDHLHQDCFLCNIDLRPSNIQLFLHPSGSHLEAKIAGFESSIGFGNRPEQGKHSSIEESRRSDLLCLGVLLIKLLSFLLLNGLGNRAVSLKRLITLKRVDHIMAIIADPSHKSRIHAKALVESWLILFANADSRAASLRYILLELINNESTICDIHGILWELKQSSLHFYWDGAQILRFTLAVEVEPLNTFDRIKYLCERALASRIDWSPISHGHRPCLNGQTRLSWFWCNEELDIDVSDAAAQEYQMQCIAITRLPIEPTPSPVVSQRPGHTGQHVSSQYSPPNNAVTETAQSNASSNPVGVHISTQQRSDQDSSYQGNIYWCVDRCWSEPAHTERAILDASKLAEDIDLFEALARCYKSTRGFKGRILSWKCCTDVAFVKYCVNEADTSDVSIIDEDLPDDAPADSTTGYRYALIKPKESHKKMTAKKIVRGIQNPRRYQGSVNCKIRIPKHLDIMLRWPEGTTEWGVHAIEGYSIRKMMYSIGSITAIGIIFMVLWLVLVDKRDIQGALALSFFIITMTTMVIGIPQMLKAA